MKWSDLSGVIGGIAPMLGTLIGGPVGGGVGAMIASALGVGGTPDEVSAALKVDPDAAVKIKQIEATRQVSLQQLVVQAEGQRLAAEQANVAAVNSTMQAETKGEHWPTYSWRPFIGFCVGLNTLAAALLTLLVYGGVMVGAKEASGALPTLPLVIGSLAAISGTVLPILGIASYFRGKAQADPNIPTDMRG